MTLTAAQNGFLKQLLMVVVLAIGAYVADASHLTPVIGATAAVFVSALASSFESYVRDQTGKGLFGAARVR